MDSSANHHFGAAALGTPNGAISGGGGGAIGGVLTETINTLRFASRAKNIKLNVKKNEAVLDLEKDKVIEKLRLELTKKDATIDDLRKDKMSRRVIRYRGDNDNNDDDDGGGEDREEEIQGLKEKLIQLESENKILIENQTHLTRLLESRNYNSTILKNDIIEQVINNDLNVDDLIVRLEELFKSKFIEAEEYRSYVSHLENSLRLEITRNKQLERVVNNNESSSKSGGGGGGGSSTDDVIINQQREEISDLTKTLQNKEKIINFLKSSIRLNDNLINTINNENNNNNNYAAGPSNAGTTTTADEDIIMNDTSSHRDDGKTLRELNGEYRKIRRDKLGTGRRDDNNNAADLSGVLEVEEGMES
jgi:hypothetical protein